MKKVALWLLLRGEAFTAIAGVAISSALVLLLSSFFLARGAPEPLEGRLVAFGLLETETGSRRMAHVRAQDRTYLIRLAVRHPCRVGDTIRLRRYTLWWGGAQVAAAHPPCPSRLSRKEDVPAPQIQTR